MKFLAPFLLVTAFLTLGANVHPLTAAMIGAAVTVLVQPLNGRRA